MLFTSCDDVSFLNQVQPVGFDTIECEAYVSNCVLDDDGGFDGYAALKIGDEIFVNYDGVGVTFGNSELVGVSAFVKQ